MGILSGLLSRSKRKETFLVFDIGNASIGGAIVDCAPDALPVVRYSIRKEIPFQEDLDLNRFLKFMLDTLETIATELQAEATLERSARGGRALKIAAVLSAPWYASDVRTVHLARETPFSISQSQFAKVVEGEVTKFKDAIDDEYEERGIHKVELEVIESTSVLSRLNGYPTDRPFDRTAREVDLTLYLSVSPKEIIDSIREKIEHITHFKKILLRSFSLAFFDAVRDTHPDILDFLQIDLTGEVTEISLVRNGALAHTFSFPFGRNFLVRGLMLEYGANAADIFSRLSLYASKEHDARMGEKLHQDSTKLAERWLEELGVACASLGTGIFLPNDIFLAADRNVRSWFADALTSESAVKLFSDKEPIVHVLDGEFLVKEVPFNNPSSEGEVTDPFLAIDSRFISKIGAKR